MLVFILGGVRSGKSQTAEWLARSEGRPVTYVATASVIDDEFRARVAEHRLRRPVGWETVEEPMAVDAVIAARPGRTLIVDCLGCLMTNVLFNRSSDLDAGKRLDAEDGGRAVELIEGLADAAARHDGLVIIVSNEVGQGVVPPYPSGRLFRDTLGRANQIMARRAHRVYYMVAGIPLALKEPGPPIDGSRRPGPS